MITITKIASRRLVLLLGLIAVLGVAMRPVSAASNTALDKANPKVQAVLTAQARYGSWLLTVPGVEGIATGIADGQPSLLVFAARRLGAGTVPTDLAGVHVTQIVTGKIRALKKPPGVGGGNGGGNTSQTVDPTVRFNRPVPIGVSTGNAGQCSAGTISARVKDKNGNIYALSNNHVYALENAAPIGSEVLQPGLYDTGCSYNSANHLGALSDFNAIVFSTSASNEIDAAIALTTTGDLGNATPSDGYGPPSSTPTDAKLNQRVQKYGRTTGLTHGTVIAINATINVGYSSGTARFVNQIVVNAKQPFIKAGDSGSLLVTDNGNAAPVGLLFAGDNSGKYAFANPIGPVLNYFGVAVDGK